MIEFLIRETHFIPDDYQKTIFDIDYPKLAKSGITTLLIDLDNTVMPYDQSRPHPEIVSLFDRIHQLGLVIVIISNNHEPRVQLFASLAKCLYVHSAKKPFARGFKQAARLGNAVSPEAVCVIGDQFMTDVWGGKRLGYHVIVVDALKRDTEKWYTRLNRRIEVKVLAKIKRKHPETYQKLHLAEKR